MSARAEAIKKLHACGARLCRFVRTGEGKKKPYKGDNKNNRGCSLEEALAWPENKMLAIRPEDLNLAVVDQDGGGAAARKVAHKLLPNYLHWYETTAKPHKSHTWYLTTNCAPTSLLQWEHGECFCVGQWAIVRDFVGLETAYADYLAAGSAPGDRLYITYGAADFARLPGVPEHKAPDATPAKGRRPQIDTLLNNIPPGILYPQWIGVGHALHHELGEAGLPKWIAWSKGSDKYEEGKCDKHWRTFTAGKGRTLGYLVWLAGEHGYRVQGGKKPAPGGAVPKFDRVVRVGHGTAPKWELTQGEITIIVTHAEIMSQARFRNAWAAVTGEVINVKPAAWYEAYSGWWEQAEVAEAPDMGDLVWAELEEFCTNMSADNKEGLLNRSPYTDDRGTTWFRALDFRHHLITHRIQMPIQDVWSTLRERCPVLEKTISVKGKGIRCCGVPAFDEQNEDFSVPDMGMADGEF